MRYLRTWNLVNHGAQNENIMAYKKNELIDLALESIEANRLFTNEDLIAYLPCGKDTFYRLKLNEHPKIKEAIYKNRAVIRVSLKAKWYKSGNPTLQLALYKLICEDEDRVKLSQTNVDLTSKGDKVYNLPPLNFVDEDEKK